MLPQAVRKSGLPSQVHRDDKFPVHQTPKPKTPLRLALEDLYFGLRRSQVWWIMAWLDIKQRYRRSVLGPFWVTLSMGIHTAALGVLYSTLFKVPDETYIPYLALGLVVWMLISTSLIEGCSTFVLAEGIVRQVKMPYSVHVLRVLTRNLIIFGHNLPVGVVALFLFPMVLTAAVWLVIPGLLLLITNLVWVCLLLGIVCTRFRDVTHIVTSVVQLVFFITPVMWPPELLGRHAWIAQLNPFFALIDLVRSPLMGTAPQPTSWAIAVVAAVVGSAVTLAVFVRFRRRIAYWI